MIWNNLEYGKQLTETGFIIIIIILMPGSIRGAEDNAVFWTKEQDEQKTNKWCTHPCVDCVHQDPARLPSCSLALSHSLPRKV